MDAGLVVGEATPAARGAREADIERVYRERLASFVRVAAAITGDRDSARDAVHDAFAGALRGREGFRADTTLEAWLWAAVVNRARNQRRGHRRRRRHEDPGAAVVVTGAIQDAASDPAIRAMVAALPERQRLVLFLRYFADLDYATIAAAAGIRVGTVSATLSAAHAAIRAQIEGGEGR